jgi:ABC-type uncharacterized transport system permease subunit
MVPGATGRLSAAVIALTGGSPPAGGDGVPVSAAGIVIPGPTHGQVLGLCLGVACFAAAALGSAWTVRRSHGPTARSWVWAWVAAGLACNAVLLLWRAEQQAWACPLKHRFDALLLLATLVGLAGLWADLLWRRELTGAAFAPLAGVLEISAFTGLSDYTIAPGPQPAGILFYVHVAAFVLAGACLAVAGVAGGSYLALDRRLRRPGGLEAAGRYPSLEALERLNIRAATLGFPLLTIGLLLGMLQIRDQPDRLAWLMDAKVVSATIVWGLYAILLHLHHVPTFRGTRTAWLSMLSTLGLLMTFVISTLWVTRHP